jgi:hypothetical protein
MLVQGVENGLDDTIGVRQHVVVPEAKHEVTQPFQGQSSLRVLLDTLCMLPAVKFDDDPCIGANEVDDEPINRRLPSEFPAFETAIAQAKPQHAFGIRLMATKSSRCADISFHGL